MSTQTVEPRNMFLINVPPLARRMSIFNRQPTSRETVWSVGRRCLIAQLLKLLLLLRKIPGVL